MVFTKRMFLEETCLERMAIKRQDFPSQWHSDGLTHCVYNVVIFHSFIHHLFICCLLLEAFIVREAQGKIFCKCLCKILDLERGVANTSSVTWVLDSFYRYKANLFTTLHPRG